MGSSSEPPPAPTWPELLKRAQDVVDRRSGGYVMDALEFARWILRDGVAMMETLTATQTRCTELVEENRKLKADAAAAANAAFLAGDP